VSTAGVRGAGAPAAGVEPEDRVAARIGGPDHLREGLRRQLLEMPAFRALLRSAESALMGAAGPFATPVLDLGCGDGHFAAVTPTFAGAVGLDPDTASLAEARSRSGLYRLVVRASATEMPFATGSIATVVANSVLEHIPDLESTLAEVARVLRPGGRFLITSPSHRFPDLLLGSTLLRGVALRRAAAGYGSWFNRHSRHFHTLSQEGWRDALGRHHMSVDESFYYFPARSQRVFDALHYLGAPTLVARRATGRWIPWRNPLTLRAALSWLGPLADPRPVEEGACVWCAARRDGPYGVPRGAGACGHRS
jgi:SAM-dependent methyltransferase